MSKKTLFGEEPNNKPLRGDTWIPKEEHYMVPEKKQARKRGSMYSEKFKDPRWQKKRLKIMERDEFKCRTCFVADNTLHVHHIIYLKDREPWDYDDSFLISLCGECHKRAHTINIKDAIIEHIVIYGIDEAIERFFKFPIIDGVLEMWNGSMASIQEWYEKELNIEEYLKNHNKDV